MHGNRGEKRPRDDANHGGVDCRENEPYQVRKSVEENAGGAEGHWDRSAYNQRDTRHAAPEQAAGRRYDGRLLAGKEGGERDRIGAIALVDRHRVVCPDLRGYGDSAKPPGNADHANYSKRAMAADLVGVMRALGHERFALVVIEYPFASKL